MRVPRPPQVQTGVGVGFSSLHNVIVRNGVKTLYRPRNFVFSDAHP